MGGRTGDNPQDLACGGLLRQRFCQLPGPLLQLYSHWHYMQQMTGTLQGQALAVRYRRSDLVELKLDGNDRRGITWGLRGILRRRVIAGLFFSGPPARRNAI